jgi:hypothetical protein
MSDEKRYTVLALGIVVFLLAFVDVDGTIAKITVIGMQLMLFGVQLGIIISE